MMNQPDQQTARLTAEITEIEAAVLRLRHRHRQTWRNKPDSYWFARLAEELGELGASLNGRHEHDPDYELREISSICLNWLEMREGRADNESSRAVTTVGRDGRPPHGHHLDCRSGVGAGTAGEIKRR